MENTVSMAHSHYSHVRYVRYLKHCTLKTAHLKKHRQTSSRKKPHIAIHRQDTPVVCHQPRDDVDACIMSGIPSEFNHSVMSAYDWLRRPNYILCVVFRSHSHSQPVIGFWGCHFGSFEMWVGWKEGKSFTNTLSFATCNGIPLSYKFQRRFRTSQDKGNATVRKLEVRVHWLSRSLVISLTLKQHKEWTSRPNIQSAQIESRYSTLNFLTLAPFVPKHNQTTRGQTFKKPEPTSFWLKAIYCV